MQALRAIVQPPRTVVRPVIQPQTAAQPPKAAMVAPQKAVVQLPKAGVQPRRAVLQPLRAVLQPAAVQPLRVLQPLTAQSSNPQRPALRIGVSDPRVQTGTNIPTTVPARPHLGNTDGHVPQKIPPRQHGASSLNTYQVVRPQEETAQSGDDIKRGRGSGESVAGPEQTHPGAQGASQGAPSNVVTGFLSRNINQRGQESVDPYDPFDDCEEDPFGRV